MVTTFKYVPFTFICLCLNSFLQNTCVSQPMCARFSDVQKRKRKVPSCGLDVNMQLNHLWIEYGGLQSVNLYNHIIKWKLNKKLS